MRLVGRCDTPGGRWSGLALSLLAALTVRSTAAEPDAFERLNESFHRQHAAAREREWSARGPVILVEFDKLTLINGDDRRAAVVVPPLYHRLKCVAHAPFAVYLALEGSGGRPLDDRLRAELSDLASRVQAARAALRPDDFAPDALARQRDILDRSAEFIAATLKTGSAGPEQLHSFAAGLRPLLVKNVEEAAALQIRAYDAQVAAWQQAHPGLDWGRLKVVITGSALPRKQNLATQYFARLLGVPGEGPRLVYAEGLYEEARALRLLNATAVDAKAGSVFFDDPSYLHRDLLSAAAANFLRDHAAELKAVTGAGRP